MLGLGANIAMSDRLFSLNDISDLSLYLKNGVGVTAAQWDDSSGNANHATQATAGDQAVVTRGGLNFELDEEDHYDLGSEITIATNQGFTLFVVVQLESIGANATILAKASSAHFFEFMAGGDNIRIRLGGGASANAVIEPDTTGLFAADAKFLLTVVRQSGGTGAIDAYKDGEQLVQDAQVANPGDAEYSIVGARNSAGSEDRFLDGIIYELAFYEKQLSDLEIADAHSYLLDKHKIV
tara:strand:+ start:343 stop:1059 length:717 start_codon:yes stop_codon:yes gene_type:complete